RPSRASLCARRTGASARRNSTPRLRPSSSRTISIVLKRLLLLVVVLFVALAGFGVWVRGRLNTPYRDFAGEEVFVSIPQGSSVASIGNRLVAAGVLPDALTFRLAA